MHRKHFVTVGWIVVAILAFALGWTLRPGPDGSASSSAEKTSRLVGKSSTVSSSTAPDDESAEAISVESDAGAMLVLQNSPRSLNSADIEELGRQFNTELDPIARRLAFSRLLEGLTVENALEIRAQIENLRADSSEFREFHFAWGKIGGVDAIVHGAGTDKPDMAATFAGWASAEPSAAIKWLEGLDMENDSRFDALFKDRGISGENMRNHLVGGLVHGLAIADTDMAAKFVFGLAAAGNEKATGLLGIVTGNVLKANGPVDAAKWAESLPEGGLRTAAAGRVAFAYARENPADAAEWAESFVHEENGGRIVHGITHEWARQDGASAVAWLESLGDELPGRPGAFRSAFENWAGKDPVAASEYLAGMPESPERDSAISGLVSRHRWEDPVASIVWAESISSEPARLEAITRAGQAWTRRDPAAAAEWAASSGLPEKLQQSIINPPRGRGR